MALDPLRAEYERNERVACMDGDGALEKAERAREQLPQNHDEDTMRRKCYVHKCCTARESACSLQKGTVQNMTHLVLSLRFGCSFKLFRTALRVVISRKVTPTLLRPSARERRLNENKLKTFWPDKPQFVARKMIVHALCPFDWTDTTRILVPSNGVFEDDRVKANFLTHFVAAVAPSCPMNFPSRNWTRCEEGHIFLGPLALIADLLPEAYLEFCYILGHPRSDPASAAHGSPPIPAVGDAPLLAAIVDAPALDGDALPASSGGAHDAGPSVGGDGDEDHGVGSRVTVKEADIWEERKKEQHRFRKTGMAWARSGTMLKDL